MTVGGYTKKDVLYWTYVALLWLVFFKPAHASKEVKIVYFDDFAPQSWKENGRMKGFLVDIMDEVVKGSSTFTLAHEGYPWGRAQKLVEQGRADAFISVPTKARRVFTNVSQQTAWDGGKGISIFTAANHPSINSFDKVSKISDLSPYKIVDYQGNGWAKRYFTGLDVVWLSDQKMILKFLARGRADLLIAGSVSTRYKLKQQGLAQSIVMTKGRIFGADTPKAPFHLCVSKKSQSQEILKLFDDRIAELAASGRLEMLIERYTQ